MESYPKKGMYYKQAIKRGIRHDKEGSHHIADSIANQVRIHEGDKAANEARKEMYMKAKEQKGKKYFT